MAKFSALKKSLGQHFLISENVARRIVALLDAGPEDQILEIGPGGGSLTAILREVPHARLALVEKDDFWAERHIAAGLELLGNDAMQFDWPALCSQGEWKLIGNLPYNIASPLIWDIVAECPCYRRAVFMVQKEVAERICAAPNSRIYGALSVWVQAHAHATLELRVGPGCFRPPPKVDSGVILLIPKIVRPAFPKHLQRLLHICFQQRRKQLGSIFRRADVPVLERGLHELGIADQKRPENLEGDQFLALARYWAESETPG